MKILSVLRPFHGAHSIAKSVRVALPLVLLFSVSGAAAPINLVQYIDNAGFERVNAGDPLHVCLGPGYSVVCNGATANSVDGWATAAVGNGFAGPSFGNGTFQPWTHSTEPYPASEPTNAAYLSSSGAYDPFAPTGFLGSPGIWSNNVSYISQVVDYQLLNDTDYELTYMVSKRAPDGSSADYAAHFRIMILANNYAWSQTGDTAGFFEKIWYPETVSFHTPVSDPLGSNFTVFLVNDGGGAFSQVEYDIYIPEPSTFFLGGGAFALLVARRRRKR